MIFPLISALLLSDPVQSQVATTPAAPPVLERAIFGGGCFWCVEEAFDEVQGVVSTTSGYTGGWVEDPTYDEVSTGDTGHIEVVEVVYDAARISYRQLLDAFWRNVDPLTPNRQFCDVGPQYRSVIFADGEQQRRDAEESKAALEQSGRFQQRIVTAILPATTFYPAEEYHQDYYRKNRVTYSYYKLACGRVARLEELWGEKQ